MNNKIKKMFLFLTDKNERFMMLDRRGFFNKIPDEEYLKRKFKAVMGEELNLDNPKTFNEKLQWLKLYNRKPEYTMMVDKYAVREYIAEKLGEEYLIPLLGVWDDPDEIDFDALPNQFVLKCNHNSGLGMCLCTDKSKLNIQKVKSKLKKGLAQDYYITGREWPYKDVERRIICEEFIGENLTDYRLYCFNGKPMYIYEYLNYSEENGNKPEPTHCNIYDVNWHRQVFRNAYKPTQEYTEKPERLQEMIEIATKLSQSTDFLRVDFYMLNKLYIGELTFYPGTGFSKFYPEVWDLRLGEMLNIN